MRELLPILIEWLGVVGATILLALSPAFQRRRPLVFAYPRREGILALVVFVLVTAIATVFYSSATNVLLPSPDTITFTPGLQFSYNSTQFGQQIELAFLVLIPAGLALIIRRQPLLSAGLSKLTMRAGVEMGLGLGLISIFLTNKTYSIIYGMPADKWLYLPAMLVVGLVEEFVFRGYIQLRLMAWLGKTGGWVLASVLFSIWHLPQQVFVMHAAPSELGLNLVFLFAFGLLLGWIMNKSGNVLAPGIYHAFHSWLMVL